MKLKSEDIVKPISELCRDELSNLLKKLNLQILYLFLMKWIKLVRISEAIRQQHSLRYSTRNKTLISTTTI